MTHDMLSFPPELILNILSFLPVQALLRFSQTCRFSHSLARSSLHTLSLGIHPTKVSAILSRLSASQYPLPRTVKSYLSVSNVSSSTSSRDQKGVQHHNESDLVGEEEFKESDPYHVAVVIPDAQSFDYTTLLSFNIALTKSILTRHGGTLRNLNLSLWTLTIPTAKVIAGLSALRALSIRIEEFPRVRALPRNTVAVQRLEQRQAWDFLMANATWASRLTALRVEGGELSTAQLVTLLDRSRWCHELWICKCHLIGQELWKFLGSEAWEGRAALRILGVMRCGGQLDEDAMDAIGSLDGLQVSHEFPDRTRVKWGMLTRR
jgi:hypothetical protein